MTMVKNSSLPLRNTNSQIGGPRRRGYSSNLSDSTKARIFLLAACFWPLIIFVLYATISSPGATTSEKVASLKQVAKSKLDVTGKTIRNILDRVDILGYGPTHPRIGFALVGSNTEKLSESVESIISNTDLNRIFVICVVVDNENIVEGSNAAKKFERKLNAFDKGVIQHWHGDIPDKHSSSTNDEDSVESHSKKIHVIFNEGNNSEDGDIEKRGIAASRAEAVSFINILQKTHEKAGLKSHQEDIILVLLNEGAKLQSHKWITPVTSALIVPPPIFSAKEEDENAENNNNQVVALKLANAVSFETITSSSSRKQERTSFKDYHFDKVRTDITGSDMTKSNGMSYRTPVVDGDGAVALRLETYLSLPAQDLTLKHQYEADLDLSMNLWLCGDGIDVLSDVTVLAPPSSSSSKKDNDDILTPKQAARFAAVWMNDDYSNEVYKAFSSDIVKYDFDKDITDDEENGDDDTDGQLLDRKKWNILLTSARSKQSFPSGLQDKCRSFDWYVKEVNTDLPPPSLEEEEEDDEEEDGEEEKVDEEGEENYQKAIKKAEDEEEAEDKYKKALEKAEAEEGEGDDEDEKDGPSTDEEGTEGEEDDEDEAELDINKVPPRLEDKHNLQPLKELRPTNLEIISKAKPIDISYVDVTGGHKDHPHKGAKDEDGNYGYIHDETELRRNPPTYEFDKLKKGCNNHDAHYKMLTEKVFVDLDAHEAKEKAQTKRDKIFCLVYTTEKGHDAIPPIRETWGPKCDGFMVGSTKTNRTLGTVEIPHEGPEEYNNIWQKVRSMWSYIYDNYYEKYDWFHIGGDDLWLIVENLRLYLESEEIKVAANGGVHLPEGNEKEQTPLFLGRRFAYWGDMNNIFNSGGSGYTMNKAALKALVVDGFPNYFPHVKSFSEDTFVAKIFRKMNVLPYDTKDDDGGERYMPFLPGHHYNYKPPADPKKDWYAAYSIDIKYGLDHCAARSVAFHYVKPGHIMKRLHAILYHMCPNDPKAAIKK